MLRVPDEEAESMRAASVSHAVPVIADAIPGESGDGRIHIASVEDDHHVVDESLHVEQVIVFGVRTAVGVAPLDPLVGGVLLEARLGHVIALSPGIEVPICRCDGIGLPPAAVDLDNVIVFFYAAEVAGAKGCLGSLAGVVETLSLIHI